MGERKRGKARTYRLVNVREDRGIVEGERKREGERKKVREKEKEGERDSDRGALKANLEVR